MKLVPSKKSLEITIPVLFEQLNRGKRLIIFYFISDNKYPTFFKKLGQAYGFETPFISTMNSPQQSYIDSSMESSLEKACKERDVFVLEQEDYAALFKIEDFIKK